jgi:N-acetyl-anhydromuramyl-L-alanine amidase AmpD
MATIQPFNNLAADMFNLIKPYFKSYKNRPISNVDTVVLHWASSPILSEAITKVKAINLGYHFIIDKDGQVYQGSPLNKFVGHAGNSYGPRGGEANVHSIGIAFIIRSGKSEDFTEEMYNSCANLIKDIKISIPTLKYITGHHWISPGRKFDPETLNWNTLMNKLGSEFKIWKTGYAPFPENLKKCKCVEWDSNGNCKKSVGRCQGSGGYGYSERNLKTRKSDLGFSDDEITQ